MILCLAAWYSLHVIFSLMRGSKTPFWDGRRSRVHRVATIDAAPHSGLLLVKKGRQLGYVILFDICVFVWINTFEEGSHCYIFAFWGGLSWLMYIWVICPWNKFGKKAQCEEAKEGWGAGRSFWPYPALKYVLCSCARRCMDQLPNLVHMVTVYTPKTQWPKDPKYVHKVKEE